MARNCCSRLARWTSAKAGEGGPARIALDGSAAGRTPDDWLAGSASPHAVDIDPDATFNIINSSGTTGEPKGIVQSHAVRWADAARAARFGYGADTVTLLSTPLYSNTTLVVFFPTLAYGGTVVLMPRFDAREPRVWGGAASRPIAVGT